MKEEVNLAVSDYRLAVTRLREACDAPQNDFVRDALIKRFEFTFGLLWKTFRVLLKEFKGVELRFPKECLKAAFSAGWIQDDKVFNQMLDDRNRMAHVYHESESKEIGQRIKAGYLGHLAKVEQDMDRIIKEG